MFLAFARNGVAFRASPSIFTHCLFRVDAQDRCDRKQPGQAVGEFFPDLARITLANRLREFADLLDQPVERLVEAAFAVFPEVDIGDQFLV